MYAAPNLTPETLVRMAVHEGLRLFRDRLVDEEERQWTDDTIDEVGVSRRWVSFSGLWVLCSCVIAIGGLFFLLFYFERK